MERSVSVNLLLYKPGKFLRPCLESLVSQNYGNFEILIIDNFSNDGTVEEVKKFFSEYSSPVKWRLKETEKNLGFAAGQNYGIKESGGELVLMANQDIIFDKNYIKELAEVFGDERAGSAQGKLLRLKEEGSGFQKTVVIDNAGLLVFKNRRIVGRGQGQEDRGQFEKKEEVFGVDGAAPMYRRSALEDTRLCLEKCEYLDEDFVAYKEDVDLAWRLRLFGWKAYYAPKALAWHARTAGDSLARTYREIIRERKKVNSYGKFHSFKNQRLMQIKNEMPIHFLKSLPRLLTKEIAAWGYVLFFEKYTVSSIKEIFRLAPKSWQKRKLIFAKKKALGSEIEKWFQK